LPPLQRLIEQVKRFGIIGTHVSGLEYPLPALSRVEEKALKAAKLSGLAVRSVLSSAT
jgi:hypothetical protein